MKENFTNLSKNSVEAGGKKQAFHLLEDFGKFESVDYQTKLTNLGVSAEIIAEVKKNVDEFLKMMFTKYDPDNNHKVISAMSLERDGVKYLRLDLFTKGISFLINMEDNSFEISDISPAWPSSAATPSDVLAASISTGMPPDSGPKRASSPDLDFYDKQDYDPNKE